MIRNVTRPWFEVWGTEEAQNRFLKGVLAFLVFLCAVQSAALCFLALRSPTLIAITPDKSHLLSLPMPPKEFMEAEAKRIVNQYISNHHTWNWADIEGQMKEASKYVGPEFSTKFLQANATQIKIAKEKRVSQKFYISNVALDIGAKTAQVTGERILIVDGLRAATPLTLSVRFSFGVRSETNPEGVYITSEDLVTEPTSGK